MIKDIKELNFPPYATLSQATCTLQDMAEKTITTQVKIDGNITPDFTYDWEIEFKGEKYIMPLRQPQAAKENTSLNSTLDLTFQHWAQYQLKRWYFFTLQPVETGTAVADKYIASVSLNLKDFCALFGQVLRYYYDDAIQIDLNPEWVFAEEPTTIEISYSYLWDVLIQFYDLWEVRWQIEPNGSADKYIIKVGYPTAEVDHIFEYGFDGGLLKVERQVQDENIRNMLLGRGGEQNLPYRYFKDIDPENPNFPADPDWIPELRNIYFSELRGKTFRDYVKGWKTNPHRQLKEADGTPIAPYVVTGSIGTGSQTQVLPSISGATDIMPGARLSKTIDSDKDYPLEIPEGYKGNFHEGSLEIKVYSESKTLLFGFIVGSKTQAELSSTVEISIANIVLTNRETGETHTSVGIPAGSYDYQIAFDLYNKSNKKINVDWTYSEPTLIYSPIREVHQDFGNPLVVEPYDESYAEDSWAYQRGHEDEKFDPVEYVKDDASIVKYGELMGGLENNEEIYPSIQGVTVDPYGRIDEVVDVEQIKSDEREDEAKNVIKIPTLTTGKKIIPARTTTIIKASDEPLRCSFEVPEGYFGTISLGELTKNGSLEGSREHFLTYVTITATINVYSYEDGSKRALVGIPAGKYYYEVEYQIENKHFAQTIVTITNPNSIVHLSRDAASKITDTFDIWVKNIWGTEKTGGETDTEYAARVWLPILGDRTGEEAKVVFSTGMLSTSEDYEFIIAQTPIYDTSKTLDGVHSHWRLTLGKSDADLESTGLYVPSTMRQGKPGDHFFFVGIDMPHQYVVWAEERLDNYKTENLDEVKDIKPTWVVGLDKVRIDNKQQGEAATLLSQLHVGDSLRLADKRFILNEEGSSAAYETLYLQSITYTYNEPSSSNPALIPDVEIVLSDTYETTANPVATLSGEVSALTKQVGAISNIEQIVRTVGDKLYLRKDGISDRSLSPTEFHSLVTSGGFRSGIVGGLGWGFFKDANGNWVMEADRVNVRQEMRVNSLVINQVEGRGGMIIESAAQMDITRVLELEDAYVCYFDQKNGSVANLFHIDDVAYCNRFTPENDELKFYKRRVVAVGVDNITLAKGYDPVELLDGTTDTGVNGTGIPEEGDAVIQYGNYTDPARQYVKVRNVIGGGYERYLEGLDSVNVTGQEYYFVGRKDDQIGPQWFIGNRNGNYAEWIGGRLYIKGSIEMGADSTGLQDVPEFKDLENKVDNFQVGGVNLMNGSTLSSLPEGWQLKNTDVVTFSQYEGFDCMVCSGYVSGIFGQYHNSANLKPYDPITLSVWVYAEKEGAKISLGGTTGGAMYMVEIPITETNKWVRVVATTKYFPVQVIYLNYTPSQGDIVAFRDFKVERGTVATDWTPSLADQNAQSSDLYFIRQIFPTGLINNTATISQLLAVKSSNDEEEAKIVAGIYGGGAPELEEKYGFRDADHGKLMIFAGADNLNAAGSAGTRIYEDGTIVTNKLIATNADISGTINAERGTIGNFEVFDGWLTWDIKAGKQTGMFLNGATLSFRTRDCDILLNGDRNISPEWLPSNLSTLGLCINTRRSSDSGATNHSGVWIKTTGALESNDSAEKGNHAVCIEDGDICGFRLRTRVVTTHTELSYLDNVILSSGSSQTWLVLPATPKPGQIYFIKAIGTGSIVLQTKTTGHVINDGKTNRRTEWEWSTGEIVMVIWDATHKIWQCGYTNHN